MTDLFQVAVSHKMKTAAAMLFVLLALSAPAMDRFAALSMLESGDKDNAVGPAGEVTRYQIKPDIFRLYLSARKGGIYDSNPTRRVVARGMVATNEIKVGWRALTSRQPLALAIAQAIMHDRVKHFVSVRHHWPSNFDWYLLWNCPGDINHPSRKERDRAQRFANLCGRAALPRRPN